MPRVHRPLRPAAAGTAALALLAAGCGNERQRPPDLLRPDGPRGARAVALPQHGLAFTAPRNWLDLEPRGPLVVGIGSKRATLAVFRYPRTEPLPETRAQLERVRGLLVERVRARDASFTPGEQRITRYGGAPAIELTGTQTNAGRRVRVRSAHVFAHGAEYVLDAQAPPADFDRIDGAVFRPVLRSLKLTAPVGS